MRAGTAGARVGWWVSWGVAQGALLLGCGGSAAGFPEADAAGLDAGAGDVGAIPEDDTAAPVEDTPPPVDPPWSKDLVELAVPCADTPEQVYLAPVGPVGDAQRGEIVRCTVDGLRDAADVRAKVGDRDDTSKASALRYVRIAYRTRRGDGRPGIGTARVMLPVSPAPGPLPVVVAAHPSEGLADQCAPSRDEGKLNEIATPLAARGWPVIAPDFAGLGNEGTQGYLDNRDTGQSTLDAARALRRLLRPGAFSDKVVMTGYSQGGGAVLSAQALARTYGAGGTLVGVAAFAPQWPTRPNSFGFVDLLQKPDALTISFGITKPVVAVLRTYAWFANVGEGHGLGIPGPTRATISDSVDNLCLVAFGGALQGAALRVRDFFDDGLRTGLLACFADPKASACSGAARAYHSFLVGNHLTADPKGAKILYVQGGADTIMPPAEEAACNVRKLRAEGAAPQVCWDALALHSNVVDRNVRTAMDWLAAVVAGTPLPTCASAELPSCTP